MLYICICTHKHIHNKMRKYSMTITVLRCVTGHTIVVGVYNYLLLLPMLYSLSLQQTPQLVWFSTWCSKQNHHSLRIWSINCLTWIRLLAFPLALITKHGNIMICSTRSTSCLPDMLSLTSIVQ